MNSFLISDRVVGAGAPCLIVAEVAQAHDGSLGQAYAFVDAIAAAGADAVKFQTHIAAAESTRAEPWRVRFSPQDRTRYEYWQRMEFSEEQWQGLARHAREKNLIFLSSPFSVEAVELLERVGMPAWKVASGEVSNTVLLQRVAATGKPVLLSSGMSNLQELDRAVALVRGQGAPCAVLQCTTAYPCPPEKVGLNLLAQLRERYGCPVGLADHSGTIYAGLAAAALGASILEVHVTLSREMFGPDGPASVTTAELRQLLEGVRFIERALSQPQDKDRAAAEAEDLKRVFAKSIVARRSLRRGTRVALDDLAFKKPGTGLPPDRANELVGLRLVRDIPADEQFREQDLEP